MLTTARSDIALSLGLLVAHAAAGATYYIDCGSRSITEPWNSLEKVNGRTFAPGDSILLKRGTTCKGMLWPKGSGKAGSPVTIGAYGIGPLPIIDGGKSEAAIKLFNQQYWHIQNVETTGGSPYGIFIGGNQGVLRHFRIRDVVVHDVGGTVKTKNSGLIAVIADGPAQTFEDVVIDGATAYNTTQWAGIIVNGAVYSSEARARAAGVTIRNSIVHDVYGDGIVLFQVRDGLIEKCAAWNTGMQHTQTIGTPNAIWTWMCTNCVVQFNEGFLSDSPGVDGGVFDIDWGNDNNIVQYNYAHDSQGYCVSVFGAEGLTTTNSIVRHNLCVNNGRSPRLAKRQGEVFLSTWQKGRLDGVQIHNNTIYWNPPTDAPALLDQAEFTGKGENLFRNNLIVSSVPSLIRASGALKLDGNRYWYTGAGEPEWICGGATYRKFSEYQKGTGQDAHGTYADPKLEPDLRPRGESPSAHAEAPAPAFELKDARGSVRRLQDYRGSWLLVSFLEPGAEASRSQVVFLKSMMEQYGRRGLKVLAIAPAGHGPESLVNLACDWNLAEITLLLDDSSSTARSYGVPEKPTTFLISPEGRIAKRWNGLALSPELGLALRWLLGPLAGTPVVALPPR